LAAAGLTSERKMIGIKLVRAGSGGTRLWSIDSNNLDDAMDAVLKAVIERKTRFADRSTVLEVCFILNKKTIYLAG
jgi:hypothetical protein